MFDILELTPAFSKAKNRWRVAYAAHYAIRALLSLDTKLAPTFSKAQKRWRVARATVYTIRILLSLAPDYEAKKRGQFLLLARSPSYMVVNVFFTISQSILTKLTTEKNCNQLLEFGGFQGVISALKSSAENGIQGNMEDLARRRESFGSNTYQKPPTRTLQIVLEPYKEPIILLILTCATISLGFGVKNQRSEGWSDGLCIFFAVLFVSSISSLTSFWPLRQFNKLSRATENICVDVMRTGRRQHISRFDVVVGDVVYLKTGDQVPADGLLIHGHSLQVDESNITGESGPVEVNHGQNPFMLSGTKVTLGHAQMLITSVGMNSKWGEIMSSVSHDSHRMTPLQARLKKLSSGIAKVGLVVASVVSVVLLIRFFMVDIHDDNGDSVFPGFKTKRSIHDTFSLVTGLLATPVFIAASAFAEVLLLAARSALVNSAKRMADNGALVVRYISACEAIGSVTVICTNRRGSLMLNHMKAKLWLGQKYVEEGVASSFVPCVAELLHEGVGLKINKVPPGSLFFSKNHAHKAIYDWCFKTMGMDIKILQESCVILSVFDSMEEILGSCSHFVQDTGSTKVIDGDARMNLEKIMQGMKANGLRVIAFAHKQISEEHFKDRDFHQMLEQKCLTLLGVIGLKETCRPEEKEAMMKCQHAGVNIKMITADDVHTAQHVATECGIVEPDEDITKGEVVDGPEFRNWSHDERMEKAEKIRVIARASTIEKRLMVQCLEQKGHMVAVTGDCIAGTPALSEAHTGLNRGNRGTDGAEETSEVVIVNDSFVSIAKGVRWGRGLYNNNQVFSQFQLTVTCVSLVLDFVTVISSCKPPTIDIVTTISSGKIPYATLQLLWVKVIVGAFASLALTLQKPSKDVMQQPPVDQTKPFITNIMWRNIVGQALYPVVVLLFLNFKGESILHVNAKTNDTIFNILVLWQIFIVLDTRKFKTNLCKELQRKKFFWGALAMIILFQVVMVEFLKRYADTERLNWGQWGACIGITALSWPINRLVDRIPVPEKPFSSFLRG